jgi:hypothetical protein
LNWAKHNRIWDINTDAIDAPEVFVNKSIDRESAIISSLLGARESDGKGRLQTPAMKDLLLHMAKEGVAPF